MRGKLRAIGLLAAITLVIGCAKDRYGLKPPVVEDYIDPPNQPRYTLPDTADYKKPAPAKEDKAMMGRPGGFGTNGVGGL